MSELCIDASIVVKLVFKGEPHRVTARRLVQDSIAHGVILIAPPFFEGEVDTAVRKRVYNGMLTFTQAQQAFAGLDRVPVQIISHPLMRHRARDIAEQLKECTVYDSTYAALAELRDCEFWTADKPFYKNVHTVLPFVK